MNNIIELKNVYKHYITNKKNTILKKINYKFHFILLKNFIDSIKLEGLAIFFPAISAAMPWSGEILINDSIIKFSDISANDMIRADKIGIIYQQNNLLPDFTALENVYLARLTVEKNSDKAFIDAKKIIKSFGLSHRHNHFPSELSGGELQRIAISRALINKPEIILADEPTGSLDHSTAKNVFKTLYNLKNKNRLIIYATHNRFFANMADCKLELIDGIIKPSNAWK